MSRKEEEKAFLEGFNEEPEIAPAQQVAAPPVETPPGDSSTPPPEDSTPPLEVKPESDTTTPPPADPQPEASDPQPEPAAVPETKPNPMELDPLEKISNRMRKLEGHLGGLNSKLRTMESKPSEPKAPTPQQIEHAFKDDEKLKALKEEFPQWGSVLDEALTSVTKDLVGRMPQVPDQSPQIEAMKQEIAELKENIRLGPLNQKYPNWRDISVTDRFTQWLAAEDPATQALAESPDPYDAIKLLDKFNAPPPAAATPPPATKMQKLEAAIAPTSGDDRSPPPPARTEEDDFLEGFANG